MCAHYVVKENMDSFLSLCQHRRSIRKYSSRAVEESKIEYLLQCALMSPAGKRLNPWEFYLVREESVLRALSGCKTYGSQMFDTAMAGIVIAADADKSDTWMCDASIAAEHILLAAAEQGLGACWCHVFEREGSEALVKEKAGIPENLRVLCVISLGYKDEERKDYDLTKLPYQKIHRSRVEN